MLNAKISVGILLKNRYLVHAELGTGGQGTVYLVSDQQDKGTRWALKTLVLDQSVPVAEQNEAMVLFEQEANLLKSFNHPGIVGFRDYFLYHPSTVRLQQTQPVPCLVMEFVSGNTTLQHELLNQLGGFAEDKTLEWAYQIAQILNYLHKQKPPVIYRDLKLPNLMLTSQGQLKLIDFGIARRYKSWKKNNTVDMGTLGYSPPEAFGRDPQHWGASDERSDVYSFGAVLYHLLTGQEPPLFIDVNGKINRPTDWPPNPLKIKPSISAGMVTLIQKSMGYEKSERWPNFETVLQHLQTLRSTMQPPISNRVSIAIPLLTHTKPTPTGLSCIHCGHDLRLGARFCNRCGQATLTTMVKPKLPRLQLYANGGKLIIVVTKIPFLIGRTTDSGIVVDLDLRNLDNSVSRRHAEIRAETNGYSIVDLASANGTKVNNDQLVPNTTRLLRHGDRITLSQRVEIQFLQS